MTNNDEMQEALRAAFKKRGLQEELFTAFTFGFCDGAMMVTNQVKARLKLNEIIETIKERT
jgi:predicted esterase